MEIGPKSIDVMKQMAENQIDLNAEVMTNALLKSDNGKLKVTISFDLSVSQVAQDSVDIDCSISFAFSKNMTPGDYTYMEYLTPYMTEKVTKTIPEAREALKEASHERSHNSAE